MSQKCCLVGSIRRLRELAGGPVQADLFFWLLSQPDGKWAGTYRELGGNIRVSHTHARRCVATLLKVGLIKSLETLGTSLEHDENSVSKKQQISICFDKMYLHISQGVVLEHAWNMVGTSPCDDVGMVIPMMPTIPPPDSRGEPKPKRAKSPHREAKSGPLWEAYSEAVKARWGNPPLRGRVENALMCAIVDQLGADLAPKVATFYVSHRSSLYVGAKHPLSLFKRDAQGLRLEYLAGFQVTSTMARETDKNATIDQTIQQYLKMTEPQPAAAW